MLRLHSRYSKQEVLEKIRVKYPIREHNPFKYQLDEILQEQKEELGISEKTKAWLDREKREGLKRFWDEKQREKKRIIERLEAILNSDGKKNYNWLYRSSTSQVKILLDSIENFGERLMLEMGEKEHG